MAKRKERIFRRDYPALEDLGEKLPRKAIAARLGMLKKDFDRALKHDPAALLRLERGEARREARLIESLLDKAAESKSPLHEFFLLKTLHGYIDNPKPEPPSQVAVQVNLPPPMNPERYLKLATQASQKTVEGEVIND